MSLFNWGESPNGKWRLVAETRTKRDEKENTGKLSHFSINFYGFKKTDDFRLKKRRFTDSLEELQAFEPTFKELKRIYDSELRLSRETRIIHKRVIDSNPELREALKSLDD